MSKETTFKIHPEKHCIPQAMNYIEKQLDHTGCNSKDKENILSGCEKILNQLIEHSNPDTDIMIKTNRTTITIKGSGEEFESEEIASLTSSLEDADQKSFLQSLLSKTYPSMFSLKHVKGSNQLTIHIPNRDKKESRLTLYCIVLGLITGAVLKFWVNDTITAFLSQTIFTFISTVFMNGIKLVVGPLVFFSIADSLCGNKNLRSFGRIGAKVFLGYLFTTILFIIVGCILSYIFPLGNPSMLESVAKLYSSSSVGNIESVSIMSTLTSMIPANFLDAFVQMNMIQIIIISILFGVASNHTGKYVEPVQTFIQAGNALFSQMILLVLKILPAAIFCLMANLVINMDLNTLSQVFQLYLLILFGVVCILIIYAILLAVFARVNPFSFFHIYKESMLVAFSTCSSNVAMPVSMKCLDTFGVSSKVYSFSIPFGATINMNGSSLILTMMALFMCRIYSIPLTANLFVVLMITVVLLSMGAPGVAGGGLVVAALLLVQIGIPADAVVFLIPILTITDFFITMSNSAGDAIVTVIVAKSEGLLHTK